MQPSMVFSRSIALSLSYHGSLPRRTLRPLSPTYDIHPLLLRGKTTVGFPSPETSMRRPKKNQKKSTKKTRKEKDLPKTPMPRLNRKRVKKDHETKTSRHLFPPPFIRCFHSTDCDRKRYLPLGSKSNDFTLPANAICSANAFSKAGNH